MSQMFQFHTRVVSGTLGRMPLYSFLFQTQCEVFNFNILCNYNGYKAYTVLIHSRPVLVLGRFHWGTERCPDFMCLTYLKILLKRRVDWRAQESEAETSGLCALNADISFDILSFHIPGPQAQRPGGKVRGATGGASPAPEPWHVSPGAISQPLCSLRQRSIRWPADGRLRVAALCDGNVSKGPFLLWNTTSQSSQRNSRDTTPGESSPCSAGERKDWSQEEGAERQGWTHMQIY